jgi:hypothetical protein
MKSISTCLPARLPNQRVKVENAAASQIPTMVSRDVSRADPVIEWRLESAPTCDLGPNYELQFELYVASIRAAHGHIHGHGDGYGICAVLCNACVQQQVRTRRDHDRNPTINMLNIWP